MGNGIIVCGLNGAGKSTLGKSLAQKLNFHFIDNEYLAEILVDNLPGIMNIRTTDGSVYYEHGYPVGGILVQYGNNTSMGYALNNHLDFKIYYNDESAEQSSIVGFEIAPRSIRYASLNEVPSACQQEKVPSMSIQGKGASPGPHGVRSSSRGLAHG